MIFSIFKSKKIPDLANTLGKRFQTVLKILFEIKSEEITKKKIITELKNNKLFTQVPTAEIGVVSPHKDIIIGVEPKYLENESDFISEKDYKNYGINVLGINDFSGFGISYRRLDEKKPEVWLIDMLDFSGENIEATSIAKKLHAEFLNIDIFNHKKSK